MELSLACVVVRSAGRSVAGWWLGVAVRCGCLAGSVLWGLGVPLGLVVRVGRSRDGPWGCPPWGPVPLKPVRTPVAILGSLGVCIYVPASRHWLISYSPVHLN